MSTAIAPERKHLTAPLSLKEVDGQPGVFEGYLSVFGNVDLGGDVVAKGAFKRTIAHAKAAKRKFKFLWQHDVKQPIGTFEAEEDDYGLKIRVSLVLGVKQADEAYLLLKAEAIEEMSIGYDTIQATRDGKTGIRTLKELKLWEGSLVTFAMNPDARVTTVKAADFAATLQQEELQRMRWRMIDALSTTIYRVMDDENATDEAKIATIDLSLTQFHTAMLDWAKKAVAAGVKSADLMQFEQKATPPEPTPTDPATPGASDGKGTDGPGAPDPTPAPDGDVAALISDLKSSANDYQVNDLLAGMKAALAGGE